jgi:hypothetical protein
MFIVDVEQSCRVLEVETMTEVPQDKQHELVCVTAEDYGKILKYIKHQ